MIYLLVCVYTALARSAVIIRGVRVCVCVCVRVCRSLAKSRIDENNHVIWRDVILPIPTEPDLKVDVSVCVRVCACMHVCVSESESGFIGQVSLHKQGI